MAYRRRPAGILEFNLGAINRTYRNDKTFTVLLAILALLSGCAKQNIKQDFKLSNSNKANTGIIVGSLTRTGPADGYNGLAIADTYVKYRKLGASDDETIRLNPWNNPLYSGDFKDATGALFVIEAPAGDYEIHTWSIQVGGKYFEQRSPFSMPFKVEPGKVKYIGDIKIDVEFGKNIFGRPVGAAAGVRIKDSRSRDLALAASKYQQLNFNDVAIELLKLPAQQTETESGRVMLPIPIPSAKSKN